MKKIFRIILCLLILEIITIQTPFKETMVKAQPSEDYDGVLVQMGILNREALNSDEEVSRAEFSVWLADILTWNGLPEAAPATKQVFSDVSQWDWVAEKLGYLYDRKIINGYEDATFRPDEPILLSSAYSMVLNVLGYKPLVTLSGSFPTSVMEAARITGINEDIEGYSCDAKLTGEMAEILLENMLNAPVMKAIGSVAANIEYEAGDVFLNEYMNLYECEGIVTGAEGISILGNVVETDKLEIDGVSYSNTVKNIKDLLGCEVRYYISIQNGVAGGIYAVIPEKNNTVLEFDSRDVASLEGRELEYLDDKKIRSVKISPIADIVVNGIPKTEEEAFIPSYGKIRLIDNNDDRKYDVIVIFDYETIIVETVDLSRNVIYGQNTDSSGKTYAIELDSYEYTAVLDESGEAMKLENIKAGSVLTGTRTDKCLILHYSERVVTGDVKTLDYDPDGTMNIVIDEAPYFVINNVFLKNGAISAGAKGDFLIDFNGNVAAAAINKNGAYSFGYLFNSYAVPDGSCVEVKLLTESGEVVRIECSDDVRVDGTKHTVAQTVKNINLYAPCLIRYRMKDDKITLIDTPLVQPMTDFTTGYNKSADCLLNRSYAPMQYKPSVNTFKQRGQGQKDVVTNISTIPYESVVDGEALITANTVIFTVPSDRTNARDTDYGVKKKSELTADQQCDVAGYNTSGEMLVSEAIVIYEEDTQIKVAAKLFIVDKVLAAVNEDEESTYILKGFYNGATAERNLESTELITVKGHRLNRGDIIRTRQDEKEITNNIELIYSADGTAGNLSGVNQWKPENVDAIGFDSPMRCIRGTVMKKDNSVIILTYGTKTELFDVSKTTVYVMDADTTEREMTYIGTLGDIEEGREIIASTRSSSMTECIVLK